MKHPLISIIIATRNEEENIERLIVSLFQQTLSRKYWEVIVVDNASKDKTRTIAKKKLRLVYNLHDVIDLKKVRNYRGAQVNFAVSKTHSPLIFFPDADMTFDKRLLKEIVELFSQRDVDALYIPEVVKGRGFFGKVRNFERSFYNETSIDAIRVITKKLFNKIGGFDETKFKFGPDDWDFNISVKEQTHKIMSTKNKVYHHEENLTLSNYLAKKWRYAITFDEYIKKWGKNHPDIKRQFGLYYRYFGIYLEHGKWKKLIKHPLLASGIYFLRFAIGIIYIASKLTRGK